MVDKERQKNVSSDEDLVRQVLGGEKQLLEVLYERYASKIYYKCLSITKDKHTSKDLSHDIIIKIFTSLDRFQGKSDFSFWVYAITNNHCLSHIKKNSRRKTNELDDTSEQVEDDSDEILQNTILKNMKLDQLEEVLGDLDPKDRLILMMRYQDGTSVKKMADTLKIGESAVKMRLKRSRDKLAELIKEMEDDG